MINQPHVLAICNSVEKRASFETLGLCWNGRYITNTALNTNHLTSLPNS